MVNQISSRTNVHVWTLEEALQHLRSNPHDVCMQYVALVTSKRERRGSDISTMISRQMGRIDRSADLLSVFAGTTAVQESLQLDAMATRSRNFRDEAPSSPSSQGSVPLSELKGPTVASHPWREMLKGRKPALSELSRMVPADFFIVESRSPQKLLEGLSTASTWQDYILHQVQRSAIDYSVVERTQKQLMLDGEQMELLLKSKIDEICVAGSDLYLIDGSDITVLIKTSEETAQELLHGFEHAARETTGVSFERFQESGSECYMAESRHREILACAVNPRPGIHVRSNSKEALKRVLNTISNDAAVKRILNAISNNAALKPVLNTAPNNAAPAMARTEEFAFIRTLMPWSEDQEDVFVYMSDAFVRNLVGPQVRLAEKRRRICHSYLKMIDHATLLYCSERAKLPESLAELSAHDYLPERFVTEIARCPDDGIYHLAANGSLSQGVCSLHGTCKFMTPLIELPLSTVTAKEAGEYKSFLEAYKQYWRTYFDPIGIRLTIRDNKYRAETIVLPLIDNSMYTGLASVLGGKLAPLGGMAALESSVFRTTMQLKKDLVNAKLLLEGLTHRSDNDEEARLAVHKFLVDGLGNQVSFHALDAHPTFGLDLSSVLGMAAGAGSQRRGAAHLTLAGPTYLAVIVASLQLPIYLAVEVKDAAIVDKFLSEMYRLQGKLQPILLGPSGGASGSRVDIRPGRQAYAITSTLGPAKFRFLVARIGNVLYVTTQPRILDELWESSSSKSCVEEASAPAHAMLRIEAGKWKQMLPDAILSWRENAKAACHSNFGFLTAFARAQSSLPGENSEVLPGDLLAAQKSLPAGRMCPAKGIYTFNTTDSSVECSVHGSFASPRQEGHVLSPGETIPPLEIKSATATLTFIEDGLRAELVLDRSV